MPLPLFAKPVAEGSSKGVTAKSLVTSRAALVEVCTELLERYRQPVLVEEFLSGREFTVGILGTGDAARALATLEVVLLEGADAGGLLVPQQDASGESSSSIGLLEAGAAAHARSRPWRSRPGAASAAATRAVSTCGSTARAGRR